MDTRVGKRLRVLVADDHPSIRENLRYLLNAEPDLECVGVVKDPLWCVDTCLELEPDVLILDRNMPGVDGLQIACESARAAGAIACVPKDGPSAALLRAVRTARPRTLTV
jgi:chemotaxis response regulator CheB